MATKPPKKTRTVAKVRAKSKPAARTRAKSRARDKAKSRPRGSAKVARLEEVPAPGKMQTLGREVLGVGVGLLAALVLVAVASYSPENRDNLAGPLGYAIADVLVSAIGIAAYLVPVGLAAWGSLVFRGSRANMGPLFGLAVGLGLLSGATLLQLLLGQWQEMEAGGIVGGFLRVLLADNFGPAGAWMITGTVFAISVSIATGQTLRGLAQKTGKAARGGASRVRDGMRRRRAAVPIELGGAEEIQPSGGRASVRRPAQIPPEPAPRAASAGAARRAPVISTAPGDAGRKKVRRQVEMRFDDGNYSLPQSSLLDSPPAKDDTVNEEALQGQAKRLEAKLGSFGVEGEVIQIYPGPVITTYEFEPAPGVKVARITRLVDDLTMALSARSLRIVAPIPGKSVVGIEVSNEKRDMVAMREIIMGDGFTQSKGHLELALGHDTTGLPVCADLSKMPHLLVAGATGAGKSVFLNSMITSLLLRCTPRDVRMVLIDPKQLEMAPYEDIPHLLVPVITKAKPAVIVLNNLVAEMELRYRMIKEKGVRSIDAYNKKIAKEEAAGEGGGPVSGSGSDEEEASIHQHMPRLVVIVDEWADLVMTRKDAEEPITLLAQKARAAGIHLVLATQRPSVDVITGIIKANFPARIAFQVRAKVDSRTILDVMGAERLLGMGDMLFLSPGASSLQRLHGAFISDEEVERIVDFVKEQEEPQYEMVMMEDSTPDEEGGGEGGGDAELDDLYDKALSIVVDSGKTSISYLQRRLQIGYNRSARIIESMEREGALSSPDHRGMREIIAPRIDPQD
ncbi:MAG: DNA translocase FtsK 4TM domain-containing protein [Candidatus Binatia bacterium]|nr:DNA translocase FtsK 4TM domain-containing protein [Candidatus Binatia bacterium]MDG2008764.1 DNA translocase FtsK 4TM domain-containing protein [Candidatus Binatia bacterium]